MWIVYCILWITSVWAYEVETSVQSISRDSTSPSAALACHRMNLAKCNACQENPVRMKSLYNLLLNLGEMHHVDIPQRFPASFLPPEPWVQAIKQEQEKYKEWETVATIPIEQVFAAALWQCPLPNDSQLTPSPPTSILSAWQYEVQVDKKTARFLKSNQSRLATFFQKLQAKLSTVFKKGFYKLSSFCISLGKQSSKEEWSPDTLQLCLAMAQSLEMEWIHQPAGLVFLFDQMKEFSQHDLVQHLDKKGSQPTLSCFYFIVSSGFQQSLEIIPRIDTNLSSFETQSLDERNIRRFPHLLSSILVQVHDNQGNSTKSKTIGDTKDAHCSYLSG